MKGVAPDITFPNVIDMKEYGEEKEDNALPWDKIPSVNYSEVTKARDLVAELTKNIETEWRKILNSLH
ncbi:Tail-specific protease precursor [Aggregatibacter aphrophilus]|uniref:Tail-specific protease n=1 Tax=Aggregatibacter aphrophilus TaxID=732 RepID=A0A336N935_AGGAP|nr:Tail-specific protease precursor [Aggregatibacter aphrophilus]